jgi:tetratricopeptide (TPR) repeat protein
LGLAQSFIATDPKRAATIALYSLQNGLSQRFRYFLIHLRAKDTDAADVLVTAAISELGRQHPGSLFDVLMLWDYAYMPAAFYFNGVWWNREYKEAGAGASAELKRLVLNYALNTIVENLQQLPKSESAQDRTLVQMQLGALHSVIQQLLPSMQADLPRGAADLQQALVRVEQELRAGGGDPPQRPPSEDSDEEKTALEKLIQDAEKAPQGEGRDDLYLSAAVQLYWRRQFEKAKEMISKIDDQEKRDLILEPLNVAISAELVAKKNLHEAWNVANQLKRSETRMSALARVGRAFLDAGDAQSGMQALTVAQSLISKTDPSIELAAAALRVAAAFPKSDQVRISEGIGLAIQVMNKVKQDETPWSLMDPIAEEDSLLLNARYMAGGSRGIVVRTSLPQAGGFADVLARLDFDEAISLAKNVNKKPLALMLQAGICRRVIESSHKEAQKAQKP